MISALLTREVTVVRRTLAGTDSVGRPIYGVSETTEPAYWNQISSGDFIASGPVVVGELQIFLSADVDVQPHDFFIVEGQRYEQTGDAYQAINARTGKTSHLQVRCRKAEVQ